MQKSGSVTQNESSNWQSMKIIRFYVIITFLAIVSATASSFAQQDPPPAQDDLKKQIGTIIVTPGNGPNLAVADFVGRSAGLDAAVSSFNQVLRADLDFAAVQSGCSATMGLPLLATQMAKRSRIGLETFHQGTMLSTTSTRSRRSRRSVDPARSLSISRRKCRFTRVTTTTRLLE